MVASHLPPSICMNDSWEGENTIVQISFVVCSRFKFWDRLVELACRLVELTYTLGELAYTLGELAYGERKLEESCPAWLADNLEF